MTHTQPHSKARMQEVETKDPGSGSNTHTPFHCGSGCWAKT